MLEWIAAICLLGAVIVLTILSFIDIKTRLLPNELVLGFATLAFVFHLTTMARFVSIPNIVLGGIIGFSTLFLIRSIANKLYGTDALGLGDVKLMGAAGLWLGPDMIMMAMSMGALASLVHGLIHGLIAAKKTKTKPDFVNMQIPAGPGFAAGIVLAAIWKFHTFNPLHPPDLF